MTAVATPLRSLYLLIGRRLIRKRSWRRLRIELKIISFSCIVLEDEGNATVGRGKDD